MPCESCAVQFSVFKRKRSCSECERYYCSACLRRGGGVMCAPCRALSTRPLCRQAIAHLKVRDIQCFLHRQNVSTRGCVEKEELLTLCVSHVNGPAYRRRGARGSVPGGAFTSLKGFTTNINNLITSAFDRPAPQANTNGSCRNASHVHATRASPPRERFTTTPGGEQPIVVDVPRARSASPASSAPLDTSDCLEVEDLPDGWELVRPPAAPLPHDSEVLLEEADEEESSEPAAEPVPATEPVPMPGRAASHLELRSTGSEPDLDAPAAASLQDEPFVCDAQPETPQRITLEQFSDISELDALGVRQLKELLARNRVEYRGCVERDELLQRARNLYREHARYKHQVDDLPLEECCKICMSAPLECVLLECGHLAACTRCAARLHECPFCRQYVVRALRVFRS